METAMFGSNPSLDGPNGLGSSFSKASPVNWKARLALPTGCYLISLAATATVPLLLNSTRAFDYSGFMVRQSPLVEISNAVVWWIHLRAGLSVLLLTVVWFLAAFLSRRDGVATPRTVCWLFFAYSATVVLSVACISRMYTAG